MHRKIVLTEDGSHTIEIPSLELKYHSRFGAITESMHVFIEAGLKCLAPTKTRGSISLLEMGFGTGLNAFLTAIEAVKWGLRIHYTALEKFPLEQAEVQQLNYSPFLGEPGLFEKIHSCKWEEDVILNGNFILHKKLIDLLNFCSEQQFDLVYYDAFHPKAMPELWTGHVFKKLAGMMCDDGMLVTYSSKGEVQRAMKEAGFKTEKLPGPPGKREMLRAHL